MADEDEPFIAEITKAERLVEKEHGTPARSTSIWRLSLLLISTTVLSIAITLALHQPNCHTESIASLAVPPLGTKKTVFEFQPIYSGRPNETIKLAWSYLIPKGKGFVSIDKLEAAGGLLPSLRAVDKGDENQMAISVFHQLHCLWMLRQGYFAATDGHDHNVEHVHHCFEYLRQSIMCAADTALEPFSEEIHGVDGFGNEHMCRDFVEVQRWAEEMRFSDAEGI